MEIRRVLAICSAAVSLALGGCTGRAPTPSAPEARGRPPTPWSPALRRNPPAPVLPALSPEAAAQLRRQQQRAPGYGFDDAQGAPASRVGTLPGLDARYADRRVELRSPRGWRLTLSTEGLGRGTHLTSWPPRGASLDGPELVLARGGAEERYLPGPLGLEQSFRLERRPPGDGPLHVRIRLSGLTPRLPVGEGGAVELVDAQGTVSATYGELFAYDRQERELPSHLEIAGDAIDLWVDDRGATYPVTIDPLVATEIQRLVASDADAGDYFGESVGVSGDTMVVGADESPITGNPGKGAAYVFLNPGSSWVQNAELVASDGVSGDSFGTAVAIDQRTIVVGAQDHAVGSHTYQGAAYVFVGSDAGWVQEAELVASDGSADDFFGAGVAISGGTIAVGAEGKQVGGRAYQGAVYLFSAVDGGWAQTSELTVSDGAQYDFMGQHLALSGGALITGVRARTVAGRADQGVAYLFAAMDAGWAQQAEITGRDSAANDGFGGAVGISGELAIVGAYNHSGGTPNQQGAAYIFAAADGGWTQEAELQFDAGNGYNVAFGWTVSIDGTTAAVTGADEDIVAFYSQVGTAWTLQGQWKLDGGVAETESASSLEDGTAVLGAPYSSVTQSGQGVAYVFAIAGAAGVACTTASSCASGYCVDGVCCDSACGGGSSADCEACSVAAGGRIDGVCGPSVSGTTCLVAQGPCDLGAVCDGSGTSCPADRFLSGMASCRAPTGPCDQGAFCTGSQPSCPASTFQPPTVQCLAPTGPCDLGATCTGSSAGCPGDAFQPATFSCRAPAGSCDLGATCTGSSATCPPSTLEDAGVSCLAPSGPCDLGATCTGTSPACPPDTFQPSTVLCLAPQGVCDLGASCTGSSAACPPDSYLPDTAVCRPSAGVCDVAELCTGSSAACPPDAFEPPTVQCLPPSGQCDLGATCTGSSATCPADTDRPNGSHCNDGNPCTSGDACSAGACAGTPYSCSATACQLSSACDGLGGCTTTPAPDDAGCDDGDPCTQVDRCQAGACVGSDPVVCTPVGQCFAASCNVQDGGCLQAALSGASCDAGQACIGPNSCEIGACQLGTDSCQCASDSDCAPPSACQAPAHCDVASGTCQYAALPDDAGCDDGNACTQSDRCQSGVCVGSDPIACAPLDQCHVAGSCNPFDAGCTEPKETDGVPCDGGRSCTGQNTCQAGVCQAGVVTCACSQDSDCPAPGICQASVTCDVASGTCQVTNQADGSACDDNDACTSGETCQQGTCGQPTASVTCTPLDACHVAGTCDPATGVCSNPKATDGTPCTDGRACTHDDTCQAGVCTVGMNACSCTSDADCPAPSQCYQAGTCDPDAGLCHNPPVADGTPCNDQDACTQGETCQQGTCGDPTSVQTCSAAGACFGPGTCDPDTGQCTVPPLDAGAPCGDGGACNGSGVCAAPDAGRASAAATSAASSGGTTLAGTSAAGGSGGSSATTTGSTSATGASGTAGSSTGASGAAASAQSSASSTSGNSLSGSMGAAGASSSGATGSSGAQHGGSGATTAASGAGAASSTVSSSGSGGAASTASGGHASASGGGSTSPSGSASGAGGGGAAARSGCGCGSSGGSLRWALGPAVLARRRRAAAPGGRRRSTRC